jgi:hypothetical protein
LTTIRVRAWSLLRRAAKADTWSGLGAMAWTDISPKPRFSPSRLDALVGDFNAA